MPTHSRNTTLLATDQQRSVLSALNAHGPHPIAYTPYGHRPAENGLLSLLGFNGEPPDPLTGHYHLGNGYRQFNPVLMRFNSPDSWSPFGAGGLNAYGYCEGDPRNRYDPTGHSFEFLPLKKPLKIPRPTLTYKKAVKTIASKPATQSISNVSIDQLSTADLISGAHRKTTAPHTYQPKYKKPNLRLGNSARNITPGRQDTDRIQAAYFIRKVDKWNELK